MAEPSWSVIIPDQLRMSARARSQRDLARARSSAIVSFHCRPIVSTRTEVRRCSHSASAGSRSHDRIWIIMRSEEHTSELQSLMRISYAVFCLKKKKKQNINQETQHTIT